MEKHVIEMVIFKTAPKTAGEDFIQTFHALSNALERNIDGFMKRSLTKDETQDKWVEMIWWNSMQAAQAALETVPRLPEFGQYCSAILEEGTVMLHLEEKA